MIPVQDVIPSGRVPFATLGLMLFNVLSWAIAPQIGEITMFAAVFHHATAPAALVALWLLWLFGDNVEARLGRTTLIGIYVACGLAAAWLFETFSAAHTAAGIGAAGALSGVLGAYFVLLPRSRVLMLVPAPPVLVDVPAIFFLGLWWMLQFLSFVVTPGSPGLQPGGGSAMWALAAALGLGAVVCLATRRPVRWE